MLYTMSNRRNLLTLLVAVLFFAMLLPSTALAASHNGRFKDARNTKKYASIYYMDDYGAWKGFVKRGKISPDAKLTRGECIKFLENAYGNINVSAADVYTSNRKATYKWYGARLATVCEDRGAGKITWSGMANAKLTRLGMAAMTMKVIKFGGAYDPHNGDQIIPKASCNPKPET